MDRPRRPTGEEEAYQPWTVSDRQQQLRCLRDQCDQVAGLLKAHGEMLRARRFQERADGARYLLARGFDQADLDRLGAQWPAPPAWAHPRALEGREPDAEWQREIVWRGRLAAELAMRLRSVARLTPDPPRGDTSGSG